jgi:REP element-mobilizing transposase RayT
MGCGILDYRMIRRKEGRKEGMARAWRIQSKDAYYHVLSRGNEGRAIFYDDQDRRIFLAALGEASDQFGAEILAFVLMTNHYHLLLQTPGADLSKVMQWVGVTYARRFNNRHSRTGHVFQGRFKRGADLLERHPG